MTFRKSATTLLLLVTSNHLLNVSSFSVQHSISGRSLRLSSSSGDEVNGVTPNGSTATVPAVYVTEETIKTEDDTLNTKIIALKDDLLTLAERTNRGFQATSTERDAVKEIIYQLAPLNPTAEPASPYYEDKPTLGGPTLAGKWTLVYTDAPDITGLDTSRNLLSTAQLGRIGQECSPPYIKNVIEWRRPDWAKNLPLSGDDNSRVLQKVVTSASASPEKPRTVNLKVAGLELEAGSKESSADLPSRIQKEGLLAGLLSANPIDLKGPLNPPFGQFEVLYLDDEFRIIKTYQNYLAVNKKIPDGEEWF